jgi:hypothetical protein
VFGLPLTRVVEFRAVLQKGNRVQVPRLVRWEFKLEIGQVLRIVVSRLGAYDNKWFFGRMSRDGRITIPRLTLGLLQDEINGESLLGCVLEVRLEPVQ